MEGRRATCVEVASPNAAARLLPSDARSDITRLAAGTRTGRPIPTSRIASADVAGHLSTTWAGGVLTGFRDWIMVEVDSSRMRRISA